MELQARWYDGKTAAAYDVAVDIGDGILHLRDRTGALAVDWPCRDVRLLNGKRSPMLRLGLADGSPARLVLHRDYLPLLSAACPTLTAATRQDRRILRRVALWSVAAIAGTALTFLVILPWAAEIVAGQISADTETRIGDRAVEALEAWSGMQAPGGQRFFCQKAAGTAALSAIVTKLTAAREPRLPLRVSVVNTPMVNAFALPGGRILLTRGVIEFADNETELAGVIAHEIGHVDERHNLSGFVKQSAVGFLVGLFFGDAVTGVLGVGLAGHLVSAAYTRDMEGEADRLAIARLAPAGYDPAKAAGFFRRLAAREGKSIALLSTHPGSAERAVLFEAARAPGQARLEPREWNALRTICRS